MEELQQRITAEEFVEWAAFYELEPWGFHADNWRMSVIASTTANYSGNVRKALKPSDFLPSRSKKHPERRQTPEEMQQVLRSMARNDG